MPPIAVFTLCWQIALGGQLGPAVATALFALSLPMQGLWWLGKRSVTPLPPAVLNWTIVTPGLRFDHHSIVGNNWSPALNISQGLGDDFTLKMGIARAYKAPSLYQTNPNYILYSKGQGCYASAGGSVCRKLNYLYLLHI